MVILRSNAMDKGPWLFRGALLRENECWSRGGGKRRGSTGSRSWEILLPERWQLDVRSLAQSMNISVCCYGPPNRQA